VGRCPFVQALLQQPSETSESQNFEYLGTERQAEHRKYGMNLARHRQ
jgi:hypothetical protein